MVYFFNRKLLSVEMYKKDAWNHLLIRYEFTEAGQMDGHMPRHGDTALDFAEVLVNSIGLTEIAAILKSHGVMGFKELRHGVKVINLNKLDPECYQPIYEMELRLSFVPDEDAHLSLARQLMGSVSGKVTKTAIAHPGHYFYDNHGEVGGKMGVNN